MSVRDAVDPHRVYVYHENKFEKVIAILGVEDFNRGSSVC
jgi:hypothetical protein